MRGIRILVFLIFCTPVFSLAQEPPKIVVGIVVDQMRQEYLFRFKDQFGENGFRRLMDEGYMYENMHYHYVPTYTAPGHTSIYTGSTPALHGIISNSWFDQKLNESVYCAFDTTVSGVGSATTNGRMSPRRLLTTTITDEFRLASNMRSRVIGISIKDRGAIFPAGHLGQAYWYDSKTGDFITSTYYRNTLPDWLQTFNRKKPADAYLKKSWTLLKPESAYQASDADESIYEGGLLGKTTFPYDFSKDNKVGYGMIPSTPFGNALLTEAVLAALDGEKLGQGSFPDFFCISFSSTDYIGHNFGPYSRELEDCYLRLDEHIATILDRLDRKFGKDNYIVFLTADHAVADNPQRSMDHHLPGGFFQENVFHQVSELLQEVLGEGEWVRSVSNMQVFLDREAIHAAGKDLEAARQKVADYLRTLEGIAASYTYSDMVQMDYGAEGPAGALRRGFNQIRSGDVLYLLEPGWLETSYKTGTTHGSPYSYDTSVPMLWMGKGIDHGISTDYHVISDIAPTLATMLNIPAPSGTTGQPLPEISE